MRHTTAVLFLFVTVGCGGGHIPLEVGSSIPDVELPRISTLDSQEKTIRLSSYSDRVMLLNFWSVHCTQCLSEIDVLKRISEESEVQVIGIALDDDVNAVRAIVQAQGINYPVLLADQPVFERFDGYAVPYTLIVGPDQKVRHKLIGEIGYRELSGMLADAAERQTESNLD